MYRTLTKGGVVSTRNRTRIQEAKYFHRVIRDLDQNWDLVNMTAQRLVQQYCFDGKPISVALEPVYDLEDEIRILIGFRVIEQTVKDVLAKCGQSTDFISEEGGILRAFVRFIEALEDAKAAAGKLHAMERIERVVESICAAIEMRRPVHYIKSEEPIVITTPDTTTEEVREGGMIFRVREGCAEVIMAGDGPMPAPEDGEIVQIEPTMSDRDVCQF